MCDGVNVNTLLLFSLEVEKNISSSCHRIVKKISQVLHFYHELSMALGPTTSTARDMKSDGGDLQQVFLFAIVNAG